MVFSWLCKPTKIGHFKIGSIQCVCSIRNKGNTVFLVVFAIISMTCYCIIGPQILSIEIYILLWTFSRFDFKTLCCSTTRIFHNSEEVLQAGPQCHASYYVLIFWRQVNKLWNSSCCPGLWFYSLQYLFHNHVTCLCRCLPVPVKVHLKQLIAITHNPNHLWKCELWSSAELQTRSDFSARPHLLLLPGAQRTAKHRWAMPRLWAGTDLVWSLVSCF